MSIFKTYKEAVLANGSTKGVYKNLLTGWFKLDISQPGSWVECNPADYLETLESFLASGKRLVDGDLYIGAIGGTVMAVGCNGGYSHDMNRPDRYIDIETFIIQAADDDSVETHEEKEAFDAIDTMPQQVESLSCSEKPNSSEWKNGDSVVFGKDDRSGIYVAYDAYNEGHVIYSRGNYFYVLSGDFSKPETQAEREERERDEMAKQLMIDMHGEGIFDKRDWNYQKKYNLSAQQAFNLIDAGYRKEDK